VGDRIGENTKPPWASGADVPNTDHDHFTFSRFTAFEEYEVEHVTVIL